MREWVFTHSTQGKGIAMRKFFLAVALVLMASGAQASSYLDIFGTVHDPILWTYGTPHLYSGPNLEPGVVAPAANLNNANLGNANLVSAYLVSALLYGANLDGANLGDANLANASLSNANLTNANLSGASLNGASLIYANLTNASFLANVIGLPYYNALTDFTNAYSGAYGASPLFDPVAAGWIHAVPEPNTALLVGIGLAGMAARRRPRR